MVKIESTTNSRIPFSQRLFWSIFAMFLGFTACFLLFQYQREREFAQEKLNNVLGNYNYQLFRRTQQTEDINQVVHQFIDDIPQKDLRVTIIDPAGKVLFDNSGAEEFNNHNDRSEVRKARLYNEGFAIRSSNSTGKRYFYTATNIGGYIYRSALPWDPYTQRVLTIDKDFIYFMALMTLIFFFVLSRFTFSIGRTISKLRDFALNVEKDRIPENEYVFPNDELGDISKNIVGLYHRQQKAKDELSMEREKLIKHFQYAKEGFAMFTPEGREILSNILFVQFANLISDMQIRQSEDAVDIPELEPIHLFLSKNIPNTNRKRKVLRESVTVDKNGKIFLIECILFLDNSYEISINDISRQEEESRMKRQLTQNVAHELKTPVSSIQGYLETIVSNENIPREKINVFLERCYAQSNRLSRLLRDISVLTRMDEAASMIDMERVDISVLVGNIINEVSLELDEKHITVINSLKKSIQVKGNYSLLYSIFRNLMDNAIAYAGSNIQININCFREDENFYYFSFADTGIGVSPEHLNRLFERFYRVDKGRSRKLGGTGLGLAIVKNAVIIHGGNISAKNNQGGGLEFVFTLAKEK